jgi:hypothetical protein
MRILTAFAVLMSFLSSSPAQVFPSTTESPTNKVIIEVIDPSGAPLSDASVHVLQWRPVSSSKSQLVDVKTGTPDTKGIFSLSLPPGQYIVYVASRALCSRIMDFHMQSGLDRTFTFRLPVWTGDGTEVESVAPLVH